MGKSKKIYDFVVVVGPDSNAGDIERIRDKYKQLEKKGFSCKIIDGNSSGKIKEKDLKSLHGKIDGSTQVTILAHGHKRQSHNSTNSEEHYLLSNKKAYRKNKDSGIENTVKFLKKIQSYSKDKAPLNVHLHSCYAGEVAKHPEKLPENMVLITHSGGKYTESTALSVQSVIDMADCKVENMNAEEQFVRAATSSPQTVYYTNGGPARSGVGCFYKSSAPKTKKDVKHIDKFLENKLPDFQSFLKENQPHKKLPKEHSKITPEEVENYASSALRMECLRGSKSKYVRWYTEMVGVEPKIKFMQGGTLKSQDVHPDQPIYYCSENDFNSGLKVLLEKGADPNGGITKNSYNPTPLITAIKDKAASCVLILLEAGAKLDIGQKNRYRSSDSPTFIAAMQVKKALDSGEDATLEKSTLRSIILYCERNDIDVMKQMGPYERKKVGDLVQEERKVVRQEMQHSEKKLADKFTNEVQDSLSSQRKTENNAEVEGSVSPSSVPYATANRSVGKAR